MGKFCIQYCIQFVYILFAYSLLYSFVFVHLNISNITYRFYSTMQELRNATIFPPQEAFFNKLKQQHISDDDYNSSKSLFESKQAAGEWKDMSDYLRYYNLLDVEPLVQAITICFDNYAKFFNVDSCSRMSLPSIGFEAMYQMHDQALPFVFTFNDKNAENLTKRLKRKINPIRELFREQVVGGLSTVFHRYVIIYSVWMYN